MMALRELNTFRETNTEPLYPGRERHPTRNDPCLRPDFVIGSMIQQMLPFTHIPPRCG
jgi:hypothetical protein